MWVRKRIDIGWIEIAYGLMRCLLPGKVAEAETRIVGHLPHPEEAVVCLSVRSGFDLFLAALKLPEGSEVLLSALTLEHMADIVRSHGLIPVPVDLNPKTMEPDAEILERIIGPDTRILVVAHLFGGRCRIRPIVELCRRKNIIFIEDMAQAFGSGQRWGGGESDAAMFSFGTIKTATAGGGSVLRVRNLDLANRMRTLQTGYPTQRRLGFAVKLCRIAGLKFLGYRFTHGLFRQICILLSINADLVLAQGTRAFQGVSLLEGIRQKPHPALLALLHQRISRFDSKNMERRTDFGKLLQDELTGIVEMPGAAAFGKTYWVFPVLVSKPEELVCKLVAAGFDATARQSMAVIAGPSGRDEVKPLQTSDMVRRMVYLPIYPAMGEPQIRKMARIISEHVIQSQAASSLLAES